MENALIKVGVSRGEAGFEGGYGSALERSASISSTVHTHVSPGYPVSSHHLKQKVRGESGFSTYQHD